MREPFEQELRVTLAEAAATLDLVTEQLTLARHALRDPSADVDALLHDARVLDRQVDLAQRDLDAECLRLIALHQPVARDLRLISLILKSLADIERMGDYAVHVLEDVRLLRAGVLPERALTDPTRMTDGLIAMVRVLHEALLTRDLTLARRAHAMDDEIDALYEQHGRALLTSVLEDPRTMSAVLTSMRLSRSLERVGDHMENIAERVEFWLTGRHP